MGPLPHSEQFRNVFVYFTYLNTHSRMKVYGGAKQLFGFADRTDIKKGRPKGQPFNQPGALNYSAGAASPPASPPP